MNARTVVLPDSKLPPYEGAFVHPNGTAVVQSQAAADRQPAASKKQAQVGISAAGHEFVIERPQRRFQRLNSGKLKRVRGRLGYWEKSRDSEEDRIKYRSLLELRAREHLAAALEDDYAADNEFFRRGIYTGPEDDEEEHNYQWWLYQTFGCLAGDDPSDDPDGEESLFEQEEGLHIHLRPASCFACGFQDCRCDGTASDWKPVRSTLQCF